MRNLKKVYIIKGNVGVEKERKRSLVISMDAFMF